MAEQADNRLVILNKCTEYGRGPAVILCTALVRWNGNGYCKKMIVERSELR